MKIELTQDEIKMIKDELKHCRCLIWDSKITLDSHCDGDCYSCNNKLTIDKWFEMKGVQQ